MFLLIRMDLSGVNSPLLFSLIVAFNATGLVFTPCRKHKYNVLNIAMLHCKKRELETLRIGIENGTHRYFY